MRYCKHILFSLITAKQQALLILKKLSDSSESKKFKNANKNLQTDKHFSWLNMKNFEIGKDMNPRYKVLSRKYEHLFPELYHIVSAVL